METYAYYPPQMRAAEMPYHLLVPGAEECQHELLGNGWCDRITVQDGIVFVTFSCRHCGRKVCQSLDQVVPPNWNGTKV